MVFTTEGLVEVAIESWPEKTTEFVKYFGISLLSFRFYQLVMASQMSQCQCYYLTLDCKLLDAT